MADTTISKHPNALYLLSFTEMIERFSFHIMRGILVLYLSKIFLFSHYKAYGIFATFTSFLYFMPMVGGYLADTFIGTKKSIIFGGFLLSLGYFLLVILNQNNFYLALGLIVVGNGFFMPNIATCVGEIYNRNSSLRESGFSIFYVALNIGAFLPPFITAWIIYRYGWEFAFFLSGFSVLVSTLTFLIMSKDTSIDKKPYINLRKYTKFVSFMLIIIFSLIFSFFISKLIERNQLANIILFTLSLFILLYAIRKSFSFPTLERNHLLFCFILTAFSILFWMLSEQTAMSLAIYTEYNVDRHIGSYDIPTIYFFSLNPFFIILCGPFFSKLWIWLNSKRLNPSITAKFAIGTILMGLGFIILPIAISFQDASGKINLLWLILSYFLQSCGELLFSAVGLSMITELSPKRLTSLMIGIWYLATAIAYSLAGYVSKLTIDPIATNLSQFTTSGYSQVFGFLGFTAIMAGVILLFFIPLFNRLLQLKFQ